MSTSRASTRIPKYALHKASGQVVRLGGIDIYLGKHDSDESRAVYDRLIGEWVPQGRQAPGTPGSQTTLTVSRLVKIVGRQCGIYELTKKEAGLVLNQLTNSQPSLQPA